MKLLIAIPTLDFIEAEFVKCLLRLCKKLTDDGIQYDVEIKNGTLVYLARDRLAGKAIDEGYTEVLWIDSDMIFEPEIFEDLHDAHKPLISGVYCTRRPGYGSVLFEQLDDIKKLKHLPFEDIPKETFEVQGFGFGCVLTQTEALKEVKDQYGTCFTPLHQYGEDLAFCLRARKLGFSCWCEPTVRLGHIGHIPVYPGDNERWRQSLQFADGGGQNA